MNILSIKQHTQRRQTGMTLVELMVAMVISLLLIAGTITIFTSNKQAYRLNEASSRVQESGRFAFDFMRRDVRMAGFAGCLSKNLAGNLNNIVDTTDYVSAESDIANIIAGFDGTNTLRGYTIPSAGLSAGHDLYTNGLRSGTGTGQALVNTDAFVVTQGDSCDGGSVVQVMPGTSAVVKIADAAACGIQQESVVMISDCESADMFRVSNNPLSGADKDSLAHASNLNVPNPPVLSKAYGLDADVYALNTSIYYIGNGAAGEPALFRRRYSGAADGIVTEELVDGVETMAVTYGVDTDANGSANFYDIAANITTANWSRVNSARIQLSVRSNAQNVLQDTTAGDRRLRHTFTETIKIRNRI